MYTYTVYMYDDLMMMSIQPQRVCIQRTTQCVKKTQKCQSKYTTLFIYPAVKFNKNGECIISHLFYVLPQRHICMWTYTI